jgi:outer membrane assembly lipoprotein YfiO
MKITSSKIRIFVLLTVFAGALFLYADVSHAFWLWTPQDKKLINPKFVVKDTPEEQYDLAMKFYHDHEFQRAGEEFVRLCVHYKDSDLAPDAQYYAGRAYEEIGKYYTAFQNYQKTIDNYPYTKRQDEIISRQFNIAKIFQNQENPKFMEFELSLATEKAVEVYKKVIDNSPFGSLADQALMNMAECDRRMKKYTDAMEAYEKVINDHPDSTFVAEARYQLAYTRYEASLNPEYDQESTDEALKQFKQIQRSTAVPAVAQETNKLMDALRERKAESMNKIAQFYEKQGRSDSAVIYYQQIVTNYSGTKAAAAAQKRIDELSKKGSKKWGIF